MGFSAESQILGTEKRVASMGLSYVRIHLVDLYGKLVGINIPIPWIHLGLRDEEWFLLKRKNSRSCTYKYLKMGRVTASSPGKAGARRGNKGRPCGQVRRDNVTYSDWSSFNSLRKHTKKGSTKIGPPCCFGIMWVIIWYHVCVFERETIYIVLHKPIWQRLFAWLYIDI